MIVRNKNVFINIEEVEDNVIPEMKETEVNGTLERSHILGLQNISAVVNNMLNYKCHVKKTVLDFINYCSLDNRVDANILHEIYSERKKEKRQQTNIIFTSITHVYSKHRRFSMLTLFKSMASGFSDIEVYKL